MKKELLNYTVRVFMVGLCLGVTITVSYLFLTNNLPFLKAAGVGTGAPDINAKYLDGYGTATSTTASKIYISDGSGYLPDGSVDSTAIINGAITGSKLPAVVASDDLVSSADTERSSLGVTYTKKKEIQMDRSGTVRVKFDIKSQSAAWTGYGKIYVNGVATGTEREDSSGSYVTFSEDISVSVDDNVQLYIKSNNAGATAYCRNFRIYAQEDYATVITD